MESESTHDAASSCSFRADAGCQKVVHERFDKKVGKKNKLTTDHHGEPTKGPIKIG